jgi:hypothetical protein
LLYKNGKEEITKDSSSSREKRKVERLGKKSIQMMLGFR